MANIIILISQYGILEHIAHYLSLLDLFNLTLTNSDLYTLIRKSEPIFNRLKPVSLCDGHGLRARQQFEGFYKLDPDNLVGSRAYYNKELEVRVWNLRCDAINKLLCLRYGVNVCEVCYISLLSKV
jgi:hypothetical protein